MSVPADVQRVIERLASAREELLAAVRSLGDADLARRDDDEWDVRQVLHHLIQTEWLYARGVTHLSALSLIEMPEQRPPATVDEAVARLAASRAALLSSAEGIDAASFAREQPLANGAYSVQWLMQHSADHDCEHAEQIGTILARFGAS